MCSAQIAKAPACLGFGCFGLPLLVRPCFRLLLCILCLALCSAGIARADGPAPLPHSALNWEQVAEGMHLAQVPLPDRVGQIVCLRMNPVHIRFSLYTSSEHGAPASLEKWMNSHDLLAAINASMYLPDRLTSIGYLRNNTHENNSHIAARLGAFFVAEPREAGLPLAAILDKASDNYEELLPKYGVVVQNFRLINPQREVLWPKEGSNAHSVAAVGQDSQGNIYFFHCAVAITVHDFTAALLAMPIDLRAAMYVEGGSEAQVSLRTVERVRSWRGRNSMLGTGFEFPVPNILGASAR